MATTGGEKPGFSGVVRKDLSWTPAALEGLKLDGLRVAVVGGTGGIGRAVALTLAARGVDVLVVGQTFRDQGVHGIRFARADLSSMAEARRVAERLPAETLDLLVLTTGIMTSPTREETPEGLERDLAVSYLSRLTLLRELAPRLGTQRAAGRPKVRVFVMGFPGTDQAGLVEDFNSEKKYESFPAHMNTVAGNEALVLDAAARYPHLNVFGLNPGLIKTNIRANALGGAGTVRHRLVEAIIGVLMMSAEKYAQGLVPLLVAPELEAQSGAMFNQKVRAIHASRTHTPQHVERIIRESEVLLARALGRSKAGAPLSGASATV